MKESALGRDPESQSGNGTRLSFPVHQKIFNDDLCCLVVKTDIFKTTLESTSWSSRISITGPINYFRKPDIPKCTIVIIVTML